MDELTPEQIELIEEMVARRMANTGEDRRSACLHINHYIIQSLTADGIPAQALSARTEEQGDQADYQTSA